MAYYYLSDIYGGPIPYAEALGEDATRTGSEVYAGFLSTLEEQIAILDESEQSLAVFTIPLTGITTYVSEVFGLAQGDGNSNADPTEVSLPNVYAIGETAPTILLDYAEVEFMLAELAARGIDVGLAGTAEEHYESGIKTSFEFAGLSTADAEAYIASVPYL